jgi:hypothetical protein
MSQTVVNDAPGQAYAGKVQYSGQYPTTQVSRIAGELIYFGKLVVVTGAQLTPGDQSVTLPTSAAEALLAAKAGGVSMADPSVEAIPGAAYGAFVDESVLPVMRKGALWVQTEQAITDLANGVFVRVANAGAIPAASLGSFGIVDDGDTEPAPEGMGWAGAVTIGGLFYGLLEINLPA